MYRAPGRGPSTPARSRAAGWQRGRPVERASSSGSMSSTWLIPMIRTYRAQRDRLDAVLVSPGEVDRRGPKPTKNCRGFHAGALRGGKWPSSWSMIETTRPTTKTKSTRSPRSATPNSAANRHRQRVITRWPVRRCSFGYAAGMSRPTGRFAVAGPVGANGWSVCGPMDSVGLRARQSLRAGSEAIRRAGCRPRSRVTAWGLHHHDENSQPRRQGIDSWNSPARSSTATSSAALNVAGARPPPYRRRRRDLSPGKWPRVREPRR